MLVNHTLEILDSFAAFYASRGTPKVLCVDSSSKDRFNNYIFDEYFTISQVKKEDPKLFRRNKKGRR